MFIAGAVTGAVRSFFGKGDFFWILFTVYRIYRPVARRPHKRKGDAGAGARGPLRTSIEKFNMYINS